jgi:hypothetical protein
LAWSDAGLTNGTTYYYAVAAFNPLGQSTNSAPVTVVPGSLDRLGWVATASTAASGDPPSNATDGDLSTRWSTGQQQANGQWFQLDMAGTNTVTRIVLDATPSPGDYPRGYQVRLSLDGVNWSGPVASGAGTSPVTTIDFAPQSARFLRITQTGSASGLWWSIHEANVFGGTPPRLEVAPISGYLQVSWPADNSGWILQAQTNSPGLGLGTNWYALPGSATTNQVMIPISPSAGSVFLRLIYPAH